MLNNGSEIISRSNHVCRMSKIMSLSAEFFYKWNNHLCGRIVIFHHYIICFCRLILWSVSGLLSLLHRISGLPPLLLRVPTLLQKLQIPFTGHIPQPGGPDFGGCFVSSRASFLHLQCNLGKSFIVHFHSYKRSPDKKAHAPSIRIISAITKFNMVWKCKIFRPANILINIYPKSTT